MSRLQIVAQGKNDKEKAQARGKLFERIIANVMRCYGYEIDKHLPNVTYSGMEIDIEGRHSMTGTPVYAECKCYTSDVDCANLQTFYAKYMTRWFRNNKCHGLFVALPGINSQAMGFYRDNCESNNEITVRLLQEPEVFKALIESKTVINDEEIVKKIGLLTDTPGDNILICSDKGFFWLQYIVPAGSGIVSKIQLFDSLGHPITDQATIDYLSGLVQELREYDVVSIAGDSAKTIIALKEDIDDIVELRGSSSCFEYQFPASPEFFVGRTDILASIDDYIDDVLTNKTSSRGILFEANSGWGKSSVVLATVDRLQNKSHYAIAIDSRSASSSQFVLRTVQYVLDKYGDFDGLIKHNPIITGFDGAVKSLIEIGDGLKSYDKLLVIFFDQFENIFHLLDVLIKIAQLSLKIADSGTNVVLGFSWKTDLVGLTREFPYKWRDMIINSCRLFDVRKFSEIETEEMLNKLATEMKNKLRKDLKFFLSEFSQGYPWLLKKLCAHVRNQRLAGISQADMARSLLNVEQLFLDDIKGLSASEEDTLRGIARNAPVSVSDIGEEFDSEIIQSLVNRRLIVKIGTKYDIYWDIFRDYLNTGKLPIQEIYLLRTPSSSILRAVEILQRANSSLNTNLFKSQAQLSDGAFLNIARDLRLLGIAKVEDDNLILSIPVFPNVKEAVNHLSAHLNDRLRRNRAIYDILKILNDESQINIDRLAEILKNEFPYISAVQKTWQVYAQILADWLDLADLAILDESKSLISKYQTGSQIRERTLPLAKKRSGVSVPKVHFAPVVQVATRLISAIQRNEPIDWSGIPRTTIYKSLSVLEEMSLISRKANTISISSNCHKFVTDPQKRKEIAIKSALQWPIFKSFIEILNENQFKNLTHNQLGIVLKNRCNINWTIETAKTNAKIMLDWARHLELAPGTFAHSSRGQFKGSLYQEEDLFDLFDDMK